MNLNKVNLPSKLKEIVPLFVVFREEDIGDPMVPI